MAARILLAVALLAHAASGDVLIVDSLGGPGADSTTITAAVDAATDGDILLIRTGSYFDEPDTPVIDDKGIVLLADGADVAIEPIAVMNLSAGKQLTVRGIEITGSEAFTLVDCEGQVRFEDCSFVSTGYTAGFFSVGYPGASIRFCDGAAFNRCVFKGGKGVDNFVDKKSSTVGDGGPGCFVRVSQVAFYDCVFEGGYGGQDYKTSAWGGSGGDGLEVVGGQVLVSGGRLAGGGGGAGGWEPGPFGGDFCGYGGPGGNGLVARGSNTTVFLLSPEFDPGPGGAAGGRDCSDGPDGTHVDLEDGALSFDQPADPRGLAVSPVTREGEDLAVSYTGLAGDDVFIWLSLSLGYAPLPSRQGVFLLGTPLLLPSGVPFGSTDGTGTLQVDLPIGELGPGIEGGTIHFQTTFRDADSGKILLGPMSAGSLVDASF